MNGNQPERSPGKIVRMAEWLDAKLTPTLGGPPLGPYGEEPDVAQRLANAVCPICGHPMGEHQIDHSTPNAILTCPVAAEPHQELFEPLNEVGMTKRAPSAEC